MFVTTYAGPPPLFTHIFGWAKLFSISQTYFKFHLWTYLCSSASVRCEGCARGTMDFSDPSRNDHPEYDDIETTRLIATSLYEKGWCRLQQPPIHHFDSDPKSPSGVRVGGGGLLDSFHISSVQILLTTPNLTLSTLHPTIFQQARTCYAYVTLLDIRIWMGLIYFEWTWYCYEVSYNGIKMKDRNTWEWGEGYEAIDSYC